jgi:hypothetical protein
LPTSAFTSVRVEQFSTRTKKDLEQVSPKTRDVSLSRYYVPSSWLSLRFIVVSDYSPSP